jgi:hypothetical protein
LANISGSSFKGIRASTPDAGVDMNVSVDDLLELSSRLNDSSRADSQLNGSVFLNDTQFQDQMLRVQQRLPSGAATQQLEDNNGYLEVETLDALLENLGCQTVSGRAEHVRKFMQSQSCDEQMCVMVLWVHCMFQHTFVLVCFQGRVDALCVVVACG